jgi:hypothetical protein
MTGRASVKRGRCPAVSALFALSSMLQGLPALAQELPRSDAEAAAQVFFARGREAAQRGDAKVACENFAESLRLDVAVGTLFNLAKCEEDLGRLANAWQHIQEGINRMRSDDPRRRDALSALTKLDAHVPRLTILLQGDGEVERNGVALSAFARTTPLPVNPGKQRVVVRLPGHEEAVYEFEIAVGEKKSVQVAAGLPKKLPALSVQEASVERTRDVSTLPDPVRAPVDVVLAPRKASWVKPLGFTLGGLGVVGLGVGGVAGAVTVGQSQIINRECDANNFCSDAGLRALDRSRTFGTLATISLLSGAALLLGGALLLWLGPTQPIVLGKNEQNTLNEHATFPPLSVRPSPKDAKLSALPGASSSLAIPARETPVSPALQPVEPPYRVVETQPEVAVPDSWPKEVPIYPGRVTSASVASDSTVQSCQLTTRDSFDEVHAFYARALSSWVVLSTHDSFAAVLRTYGLSADPRNRVRFVVTTAKAQVEPPLTRVVLTYSKIPD